MYTSTFLPSGAPSYIVPKEVSSIGKSFLRTLLYSDIFNYPLTREELRDRCSIKDISDEDCVTTLLELTQKGLIFCHQNFYSLQNNYALAERRTYGNSLAQKYLKTARFISACMGAFPYVRAVFLSGSISKNFMDSQSDIDYFIITEPKRLWLSKTILFCARKTLIHGFAKYLCLNYFIDTACLEIEQKNWYTAIELVTLISTYNEQVYTDFYHANTWTASYFPNMVQSRQRITSHQRGFIKKMIERMLNGKLGDALENRCMHYMIKRHRRKFTHCNFTPEEYAVAFQANEHVAKLHTHFHQKKILEIYQQKIEQFEKQFNIRLD